METLSYRGAQEIRGKGGIGEMGGLVHRLTVWFVISVHANLSPPASVFFQMS